MELPRLRTLASEQDRVRVEFAECGALAMIVADLGELRRVEERYGAQAHRQVMGRLADRMREVAQPRLEDGDELLIGELGRHELLLVFLRDRKDHGFYRQTLPALVDDLEGALSSAGRRAAYPFEREPLRLGVGSAVVFYDPTCRVETVIRRARAQALDDARLSARISARARAEELLAIIFSESVHIVFEPIVDLQQGNTIGFEALVRGEPGSALATPAALFGAARENHLLFELDCLCRRAALREAKRLPPGSKLFLNCLPSAIHDPAFGGDALRRSLQGHQLQPSDVVFEISERESIANFAIFRESLEQFADLGIQIALDDIGVGYGSLEAVTELRPQYVKVDIAFVRGIESDPARQEVLSALKAISSRIDGKIIAEGIETREQLATLKALGVPYGQGYLFGPGPRDDSLPSS